MTGPQRASGGPLISVILAVRGVAEYLPGCLDSILGQPDLPAGIEVIAVDDASPDGCGAILDARAAADPRLRVIHLAGQAGPGRPDAGPGRVGRRVRVVRRPRRPVAEGSLATIADRLERDRPDVLLLDYRILRAAGGSEPSPGSLLLAAAPGVLTLADRPALPHPDDDAVEQVLRLGILDRAQRVDAAGIHEDVPVSATACDGTSDRAARSGLLPVPPQARLVSG